MDVPEVAARAGKIGLSLGTEMTDCEAVRDATALGMLLSEDKNEDLAIELDTVLEFDEVACIVLRRDKKFIRFFCTSLAGNCGWLMKDDEGPSERGSNDVTGKVGAVGWG